MFFLVLMLIVGVIIFYPYEIEQPSQKHQKALTNEARLQMKINRALEKEKRAKDIKRGLFNEFYTYNPHGSPWEFNEWKERANMEDKANNPQRYQVGVRKPPKQKHKKLNKRG